MGMKRGRPFKKPKDRRGTILNIRVTDEESKQCEIEAKKNGQNMSEWLRSRIVPGQVPLPPPRTTNSWKYGDVLVQTPSDMSRDVWQMLKGYVTNVLEPHFDKQSTG